MTWKKREATELSSELIEKYQLSPLTAKLFSLREINTDEKLNYWLNSTEEDFADPYLMHGMQETVDRINQAIDNFEKITIYGDYDADGITATTIMYETLAILGADVHYFIPDRFKDGYGPSMKRYQQIVADGTKLIITVDNGVTGIEEVRYAQDNGCDVIVTDHHSFQEQMPEAKAIVHCNYPNQKYPFDDYCGAGVAYTICRALMEDTMPELIELAMIGTIGDMVKVSGEGHIIVKRGLELLNHTQRPGLRALIKEAGLELGNIDETDTGFQIAPRLNATGRLASARLAVDLLLSDDLEEAQKLAKKVEELNNERKELTQKVYESALNQIKKFGYNSQNTLVLYDSSWHEGVLGLVANKIVEKVHKPTILLTKNEDGLVKGSGRSNAGFNLFEALFKLKDSLFENFGGHDFACGLSLKEDKINSLRKAFENSYQASSNNAIDYYDLDLDTNSVDLSILDDMKKVGPFGTDNPEPVYCVKEPEISSLFVIGKDKNHLKFNVGNLKIIGFNMAYLTQNLLPYVTAIYLNISKNMWQKKLSLQGQLKSIDFGVPSFSLGKNKAIDFRRQRHILGFADRFVLFDEHNLNKAVGQLEIDQDKIILAKDYEGSGEIVTLLDAPHNRQELDQVLKNEYQQLYLRFMIDQLPISMMPSRTEFAKTLKYVYSHPNLKPEDYRLVAPYLGLDGDSIYFILRVFLELEFVKMDKAELVPNKVANHKKLTDSRYFLGTQSQLNFVTSLRTMPSSQLLAYVNQHLK
ncbi:single-stranded-DNA-specific exonuclease RecJ [Lactobacillus jensenii 27-2-CHN]|nr:single-stranded-DNA-specific exonuclease RecJ [Lactobacillus jensenii 27-2-CHN]EEX24367.1 single-stranded-DNA-specific exonuclease RecJ [Lactobacillus jensenii 115-3-CHN]